MHRVFWIEILFLSALGHSVSSHTTPMNCTYLQNKVPKPQLTYMLGGQIHVTWRQDKTAGYNYTAHVCHTSLRSYLNITYPNSCPQFQAMTGCTLTSTGSNSNIRQCSMSVSQYFEYTVYLSASHQGCQLTGEMVKIKPSLSIAHPGPVPMLDVYSQSNALLIEWTKTFRYVHLVYSLRCQQLSLNNAQRVNLTKSYLCCIRVRLPYGISPYYSEVCKTSRQNKVPVLTSKFHCGYTHECKRGEVKNLSDFAGHLMPDDSTWPNSPPAMVLQIEKRQ